MVKRPVTDLRILPGSRYGLGSTRRSPVPGRWPTSRSRSPRPPDDRPPEGRFTALKAGGVRTQRSSSTRQATLRFGVDSGFTEPVPVMRVSALFRDRSGRIIGGADDLRQEESFKNVPPGRAQFQLVVGDGLRQAPPTSAPRSTSTPSCSPSADRAGGAGLGAADHLTVSACCRSEAAWSPATWANRIAPPARWNSSSTSPSSPPCRRSRAASPTPPRRRTPATPSRRSSWCFSRSGGRG